MIRALIVALTLCLVLAPYVELRGHYSCAETKRGWLCTAGGLTQGVYISWRASR